MTELKRIHISEIATLYAVQDKPEAYYYDATEADKVISEKDAKIITLNAEVFKQKHAKLFFAERNYAETKLRHNMYKRCLAMAEWCDAEADVADADGDYEDMRWYQKWHKRWLEIADKFKEET